MNELCVISECESSIAAICCRETSTTCTEHNLETVTEGDLSTTFSQSTSPSPCKVSGFNKLCIKGCQIPAQEKNSESKCSITFYPLTATVSEQGVKTVTLQRFLQYECIICRAQFTSLEHCREHEKIHRMANSTTTPRQQYVCLPCGNEFESELQLLNHVNYHLEDKKPYRCDLCSLYFNSEKMLEEHKLRHGKTVQQPESYDTVLIRQLAKVKKQKVAQNLDDISQDSECSASHKLTRKPRNHQVQAHKVIQSNTSELHAKCEHVVSSSLGKNEINKEKENLLIPYVRLTRMHAQSEAGSVTQMKENVKRIIKQKPTALFKSHKIAADQKSKSFLTDSACTSQDTPGEASRYSCGFCRKTFRRNFLLIRHLKSNHDKVASSKEWSAEKRTHKCPKCSISYTSKQLVCLKKHMWKKHRLHYQPHTDINEDTVNGNKSSCISKQNGKIAHRQWEVDPTPEDACSAKNDPCDNEVTLTLSPILTHERNSNLQTAICSKTPFVCKHCGASYTLQSSLKRHQAQRHLQICKHQCKVCFEFFISKSMLKNHCKVAHDGKVEHEKETAKSIKPQQIKNETKAASAQILVEPESQPFQCKTCLKRFRKATGLRQHMKTHEEKQYCCQICPAAFTRPWCLAQHAFVHSGVKPFRCDICEATFAQKGSLISHKRRHTGETPFQCKYCQKWFSQKSSLNQHIRRHLEIKPYTCEYCSASFVSSGDMQRHKLVHTLEKPHQCNVCQVRFAKTGYLKRHFRIHTGEKPYKCKECDKCFRQQNHLDKHKRTHWGFR